MNIEQIQERISGLDRNIQSLEERINEAIRDNNEREKESLREEKKALIQERTQLWTLQPQLTPSNAIQKVIVTHWITGISKVIDFDPSSPFPLFLAMVGTAFKLSDKKKRLYYIPPTELWNESRQRIVNSQQLVQHLDVMFRSDDEDMMKSIYIFTGNESPTSSPVKEERDGTLSKADISQLKISGESEASSEESSNSGKKSRGSNQKRFRDTLLKRDGGKCLICPETTSLEAAHVIDVEAKLSPIELDKYQIFDVYDCSNGFILCKNCHWKYDHWHLGITTDGFIETKIEGTWRISNIVSIFKAPEHRTSRLYPSQLLLDWKYQQFLSNRERSLISSAIALVTSPARNK